MYNNRLLGVICVVLVVMLSGLGYFYIQMTNTSIVSSPSTAHGSPTTGLLVARYYTTTSLVDVVQWDGSSWNTIVPSTVFNPLTIDNVSHSPTILSVVANSTTTLIGLTVRYCADQPVDGDTCFAGGYIYDVPASNMNALLLDNSDPESHWFVSPVSWLPNGLSVIYENAVFGGAGIYDSATGAVSDIILPDDTGSLSMVPEGLSQNGQYLLYSGTHGEYSLQWSASAAGIQYSIGSTSSPYNTSWLVFSPDSTKIALVKIRANDDNGLGAGDLGVYGPHPGGPSGSTTIPLIADLSSNYDFDFSPAWASNGQKVVFLRADANAWQATPGNFGVLSEDLPAGVTVYDLGTATFTQLLANDSIRRNLIVPGAGGIAAYLETTPDGVKLRLVDLADGHVTLPLQDETVHTAIGYPR